MATAYISLGSNVGDRRGHILQAVEALRQRPDVEVVAVSPTFETAPAGGPGGQGPFENAAAELRTTLQPEALLAALQEVEDELGRRREHRWGPRTIDLDLLLYDRRVIARPGLRVPHLRLRERRFVLEPLATIAPGAVDPVSGLSVRQLLDRLEH